MPAAHGPPAPADPHRMITVDRIVRLRTDIRDGLASLPLLGRQTDMPSGGRPATGTTGVRVLLPRGSAALVRLGCYDA